MAFQLLPACKWGIIHAGFSLCSTERIMQINYTMGNHIKDNKRMIKATSSLRRKRVGKKFKKQVITQCDADNCPPDQLLKICPNDQTLRGKCAGKNQETSDYTR